MASHLLDMIPNTKIRNSCGLVITIVKTVEATIVSDARRCRSRRKWKDNVRSDIKRLRLIDDMT